MIYFKVEEKMEEVRRLLTNPSNLTVHLSVDVEKLSADGYKPAGVWSTLVPEDKQVTENRSDQTYNAKK
jgi:hypothetical protein